jgi:outer membrane PBP1 activator LpoA protein
VAVATAADPAATFAAPRPDAPAAVPLEATPTIAHIALLLPAGSSVFARPAEAVKAGFLVAAKIQGETPLPIRVFAVTDDAEQIVAVYTQALAAGARLVVGPLTRAGVTALIDGGRVTMPTLALNVPERATVLPRDLFVLSLQVEAEARQVAQFAAKEGRVRALTINGDTPLLRRIHQAFVDEFTRLGGEHVAAYEFTADPGALTRLKQAAALRLADMVFLALDFRRARLVRPYLEPLPLYATSQVHPGNAGPLAGFDLAEVRFLDMPWLLQPDHPAVMVYPRQDFQDDLDLERLYALGIDAFRLVRALLAGKGDVALDGVTGRLSLGRNQQFARELTAAQFADGKLLIVAGKNEPSR